ncbi:MAG: metal ABC transporter permease [Rhabdochlamydiaceae bacterium]
MSVDLLSFFTDPLFRGPILASMFMCLTASLIGVLVFLRGRSLIGESLSHASYPGVVLAATILSSFKGLSFNQGIFWMFTGAGLSAFLGFVLIKRLEKLNVYTDAALCFILSVFFGFGVLLSSRLQFLNSYWYKQSQTIIFGQTATMGDWYIFVYAILSCLVISFILIFFKSIKLFYFDPCFAKSIGFKHRLFDHLNLFLLLLAICVGMKSVGVVLMSGMLIAPCIAAKQFTNKLSILFFLTALIALISAFLGNYLSLMLPVWLAKDSVSKISLPTGPMILLVASSFCFIGFILNPRSGLLKNWFSYNHLKIHYLKKIIIKNLYIKGPQGIRKLNQNLGISYFFLAITAAYLITKKDLFSDLNGRLDLTEKGRESMKRFFEN